MAKIVANKRSAIFDDEFDAEELGVETEAEKQMKFILEKQLNRNITLTEQFSQHRTFVSPSTFKSLTELVHGTCSLEKFKEIEKDEEVRQELQRCGLTHEEIVEYLHYKSKQGGQNRMVNPAIREELIQSIEERIKSHNENLLKPQEFKNVKKLTRHEMEIESSLYAGCSQKSKLSSLVSVDKVPDSDGAFSYIKTLSDQLLEKCKKSRKKKKLKETNHLSKFCEPEKETIQYDPDIHHVIVPLNDDEVSEKRLSLDEIKKLPRFEHYSIGEASKTLYIKNLHSKTTVNELRSIFGRFEEENKYPISYKICNGRMKGQAFVKFSDCAISEKALHFSNGYVLRGKPLIIEFGKQT